MWLACYLPPMFALPHCLSNQSNVLPGAAQPEADVGRLSVLVLAAPAAARLLQRLLPSGQQLASAKRCSLSGRRRLFHAALAVAGLRQLGRGLLRRLLDRPPPSLARRLVTRPHDGGHAAGLQHRLRRACCESAASSGFSPGRRWEQILRQVAHWAHRAMLIWMGFPVQANCSDVGGVSPRKAVGRLAMPPPCGFLSGAEVLPWTAT